MHRAPSSTTTPSPARVRPSTPPRGKSRSPSPGGQRPGTARERRSTLACGAAPPASVRRAGDSSTRASSVIVPTGATRAVAFSGGRQVPGSSVYAPVPGTRLRVAAPAGRPSAAGRTGVLFFMADGSQRFLADGAERRADGGALGDLLDALRIDPSELRRAPGTGGAARGDLATALRPNQVCAWRVPRGLTMSTAALQDFDEVTCRRDPATGDVHVRVVAGPKGASVSVELCGDSQPDGPPAPPPSPVPERRLALVVGVSDYRTISDLQFADEDAVSWTTYLASRGYDVTLLGDGTSDYAPHTPSGVATEANVRRAVRALVQAARPTDRVAIVTAGHGGGDGAGSSFLCMADAQPGGPAGAQNDADGAYTDVELARDLRGLAARSLFMFVDNCYSGGLLDELTDTLRPGGYFVSSTCGPNGFGFDDPAARHGAWTQAFLVDGLMGRFADERFPALGDVFRHALSTYAHASEPRNRPAMIGADRATL